MQITHVVSAHDHKWLGNKSCETSANSNKATSFKSLGINCLEIALSDRPEQSLAEHFSIVNDFIHSARSQGGGSVFAWRKYYLGTEILYMMSGRVLVHCLMGVSRSVSLTVAYLLTATDCDYWQCLNSVAAKRKGASPNFGFRLQLTKFAEQVGVCFQHVFLYNATFYRILSHFIFWLFLQSHLTFFRAFTSDIVVMLLAHVGYNSIILKHCKRMSLRRLNWFWHMRAQKNFWELRYSIPLLHCFLSENAGSF